MVSSCGKYEHLLPGFAHLFNKYMGPEYPIEVVTDTPVTRKLPTNFQVRVMGPGSWGSIMLDATSGLPPEIKQPLLFLFDDYWLRAPVDEGRVAQMLATLDEGADKADLSNNTNHFPHHLWRRSLIAADQTAPYRASTQPAIWDIHYFRSLIRPEMSPWQFELSSLADNDGATIVGTTLPPAIYDYANVYLKGEPDPYMAATIQKEDRDELIRLGIWVMSAKGS